jgi:hypothetical protein
MDMEVVQDAKEQEVSIKLPNYRSYLFSLVQSQEKCKGPAVVYDMDVVEGAKLLYYFSCSVSARAADVAAAEARVFAPYEPVQAGSCSYSKKPAKDGWKRALAAI